MNFDSGSLAQRGHTRPVDIYTVDRGSWASPATVDGHIGLEPPLLVFGERAIDRRDRAWLEVDSGERIGQCERLPLWEALETIQQRGHERDIQ